MLVLSRKPGESIRIGEDVIVTVSEIKGGRVRIGIEAPDSVRIRRDELRPAVAGLAETAAASPAA